MVTLIGLATCAIGPAEGRRGRLKSFCDLTWYDGFREELNPSYGLRGSTSATIRDAEGGVDLDQLEVVKFQQMSS
jgi:hypothetical protein